MRKIQLCLIATLFSILMSSCDLTSTISTRASLYPKMYEENPVAIVVMPPINNTTNVEAKDLLYTSISHPLIEAGYYVVSPHITMEFLKAESAYDSEMFINGDMAIFGKVFGADAVVFSIIDEWSKDGSGIQTKITYIIKSTKTNEALFERTCDLYLDLSTQNKSNGALNELVNLAITAIKTATTDHIVAARKCNYYIFSDIPRGKYNPSHGLDMETTVSKRDTKVKVQ